MANDTNHEPDTAATSVTLSPGPRVPLSASLAARLTAWYAGTAFLLILGATGFLYWALVTHLDREDDEFLIDKVHVVRALLRERPLDVAALTQEVQGQSVARQHLAIYVRILDERRQVVLESAGMSHLLAADLFPEPGSADVKLGPGRQIKLPGGKPFRILTARAGSGGEGEPDYVIQAGFDRGADEDLLAGYRRSMGIVLGLALVACALAGYQIARQGLRPLANMAETARRIRSSTLDQRLEAARLPSELAELATTFNDMLTRLEEAFQRLARFSADIAHELRTPVNNLRGEAEVALGKSRTPDEYREVLGSCLEECGRLTHLIDSLLFLARAENPQTDLVKETTDLHEELETVRAFYEATALEAGITLTVVCPPGVFAAIDRTLFQRAVGNLVANALAHTPSGGRVTLTAAQEGALVRIEVADTGSGIGPEDLPHVFDRFYRADPARTSSAGRVGLGLAIVKSIATLHRGSAEIQSSGAGGTQAILRLPASAVGNALTREE